MSSSAPNQEAVLRLRLRYNPHDRKAYESLKDGYLHRGLNRQCLELTGKWLESNPTDWYAEVELSVLASDDPEYAIKMDRYILSHIKREDDAHSYDFVSDRYAFLLEGRGYYAEAKNLLEKATLDSPDDVGVWDNLGQFQRLTGNTDAAIQSFRKSIDVDSSQEGAHEALGKAYLSKGDLPSAEPS